MCNIIVQKYSVVYFLQSRKIINLSAESAESVIQEIELREVLWNINNADYKNSYVIKKHGLK